MDMFFKVPHFEYVYIKWQKCKSRAHSWHCMFE